jgi:hypothetical protein
MNKIIVILSVFYCINSGIYGQKGPIKFGEVSSEELEMLTYTPDTSASAVILCDYGYFNSTTAQFIRTQRIKILKKDGFKWANSGYPCDFNTQIKGITTNLENGKVITSKLKNESIFKDEITKGRYVMRIAMPDVKVGSVIDLQFSFLGIMPEWKFQEMIPVRYSELILPDTRNARFSYNFFGYEPLFLSTPERWIAKEMPSFKEEPFMSSKENYLTKLEFDILDIGFQSFTTSWENITNILMKETKFGQAINNSGYLNSVAKNIEDQNGNREEMLKMAYETVKSTVKWNEEEAVVASTPALSFVYKMRIGNSADINLILLQLLKKLDFDATPVVLSTRENGFLSPTSPSIRKLNYVVVLAKIGDKSYLLDASEPYMPYHLIPFRCLNCTGRVINEKSNDEVVLSSDYKEKDLITYQLKMNEDKSLEGSLILRRIDYSALNLRKKYRSFNSVEGYLEEFKKDKIGLVINESRIENIDSIYLPVIEEYKIIMNNQLNVIGDEVYIIPMFYHQFNENPFKTDLRKYPVDYGYSIEKTITSIFEVPENYEVSELPGSINIKLPGNGGSLTYIAVRSGNTVNIKSVFSINKSMFLPDEYKSLKEFYNQVIKKHSEPIILKKI